MPTLTSTEILADVIDGFKGWFPALNNMGYDFRPGSLKLDQTYTAHIPTLPTISTYDGTTGYANGATSARSLLSDVSVTVSNHKHVPILFEHLNQIKDSKNAYAKCISNTGYVLAKAVIDDVISGTTSLNFTQYSEYAQADCDVDMLINVTGDLNTQQAMPDGRVMIVNTGTANALSADSRLTSKDFAGQIVGSSGRRKWVNTHGFSVIEEYPGMANTYSAVGTFTAEADDDLLTLAAHGLVTGDLVKVKAITNGTPLADETYYHVIKISSSTIKLATSAANATAGTAINVTLDGTGIDLIKPQMNAFAFDPRAFTLLAGIPDNFNMSAIGINYNQVMNFESVSDPETGLTMAAVTWQAAGTGNVYFTPTLVWGYRAGRGGATNTTGALTDYAGHRVIQDS